MRIIILIVSLCSLIQVANAQFGVRLKAQHNNYKNWDQVTQNVANSGGIDLFNYSYEIGVDYWFRLKNVRVEFYPEISFVLSQSKSDVISDISLPDSYKLEAGGIGLNVHVYLFDLMNDCQCPTFSKQNNFLRKGVFLMLEAKEYVQNKETRFVDRSVYDRDFSSKFSIGVGLDIGVNDLLTFTPFVATSYYPSTTWNGININHGIVNVLPPDESTSNLAFQVGVRIGFRPDYIRQNRK